MDPTQTPFSDKHSRELPRAGSAVLSADLTRPADSAALLRQAQVRQAFLLKLSDTLRPLVGPQIIQYEAARVTGEYLRCDRVGYAEGLDDHRIAVTRSYAAPGVLGLEGVYRYDDYGPELLRSFWQGRTVVRPDIASDESLTISERQAHASLQLGATVNVPLLKAGKLVAVFFAHCRSARDWSADEVQLLEAVAERVWDAVHRARAEAALRESEAKFRALADIVPQMLWQTSPAGRLLWHNRKATEYTGQTVEESQRLGWHSSIHPDDVPSTLTTFEAALSCGEPWKHEHRIRQAADGAYRWFLSQGQPQRDESGKIVSWFGSVTDIDAQRNTLDAEQHARAQAEATSQAKDQFLASASHELRTPLSVILLWSNLFSSGAIDEKTKAEGLAAIDHSAKAMQKLIDDLMDSARINSGKLSLELRPADLAASVAAAAETMRPAAMARGVMLRMEFGRNLGTVHADADRLQQVVWNLVSNAVKFTPQGGVVTVGVWRDDATVNIRVSDTGQGISAEMLPDIFSPFRQADPNSARRHGGLGLGLTISRQLIELHGGTIRAESAGLGRGASFTIELPLPKRWTSVEQEQVAPVQEELSGVQVLLIEDDERTRQVMEVILGRAGAEMRVFGMADPAVSSFMSEPPDVIVSDIGLPEKDGYALIKQIRLLEHGGERRVPALAFSAFGRPQDQERAIGCGFDAYLTKPVDPARLVKMLRDMLGR
ncbi:MAG: ATP-binding protein [Tepidisphaeraceae bacterium]